MHKVDKKYSEFEMRTYFIVLVRADTTVPHDLSDRPTNPHDDGKQKKEKRK